MPRSIKIAKVDGTETLSFNLLRIQDPYPEFSYPSNYVTSAVMRKTSAHVGNRVFTYGGITANHWDIDFTLHLVLPAEVAKIVEWFSARPPVVLFSLDGGTTRYFAIFQSDGLAVSGYRNNEDYDLAQPFHNIVEIKLAILTQTTQNFS